MSFNDVIALSPLLVFGLFCVVTMLAIAVRRHHATVAALAALSCVVTLATVPLAASVTPRAVTALLLVDGYGLFYMGLFVAATLAVIALSYGYLNAHLREQEQFEEYYLLLLLATFGALVLTVSTHWASFFLGLELLGVSLYTLIGYWRSRRGPLEAAIKYLLLSSSASAFLLFGMALLYFHTGTMSFERMAGALLREEGPSSLLVASFVMILTGIGFKLALVPFHMWAPDVYQGSPAPVTAFLATVSKGAVFALLLRYSAAVGALQHPAVWAAIATLAVASMVVGNLLALRQQSVKRILACSSIAHVGYLLVAFLAGGRLAVEAATVYLTAYVVMTLGAFGIVTLRSGAEGDADSIDDYRGLVWRSPFVGTSFILMLLSLAGIPLTVGFIGKFYAIAAGVHAGLWLLVLLLVANSAIGVYYYLRVIVTLFDRPPSGDEVAGWRAQAPVSSANWAAALSLGVVVSLLLWMGTYPEPMIELIRGAMTSLVTTVCCPK